MTEYAAFISYSHADHAIARWVHRALEAYRFPKVLVGIDTHVGPVPTRLPPIFRDRDELPASANLGEELAAALSASRFQIVLCSPRAAASKWVNEEVITFKRLHGEARTLAFIVDGEPYAGGADECFPPALRFRLAPDGTLSEVQAEPIAADIRPGKDGRRLALLKILAGLSGLKLDALARRDVQRRQRRMVYLTSASLSIAVVTAGLAVYAESQRRIADRQRLTSERSLEFLIGTFEIANPATENPRTIPVLSVLDRVSKRAGTELKDEPAVSARLLQTTGDIYFNLGLTRESERDLRASVALQPSLSEGRARAMLKLSALAYRRGDAQASAALIDEASRSYRPNDPAAPALDALVAERRAMVAFIEGRYAAAAEGLEAAAALYQALPEDHREDLARTWLNEGRALVRQRRYDEADRLFDKTADIYVARFGKNHVLTADVIRNQALADFESGNLARAEQRNGRALDIYNKVFDGDHPVLGAALILDGRIRTARGDTVGALSALDKARGLFTRIYGATNAAVGDVDFYAAEALSNAGHTDAALQRAAATKAIYDAAYGPDDPDQVELLLLRSRILARAKRWDEAARVCAAGIRLQTRIDPKDPNLADIRQSCAALTSSNQAVIR
jgi:tetratricopeptide (TPR) repeat protein